MATRFFGKLACASALCLFAFQTSGFAQEAKYPTDRISLVVGFAAGGFADTAARVIGAGLEKRLGQTVIVENRDGASGNIAAAVVAGAAPDGYTILVTTTSLAISPKAYASLDYSLDQLEPVAIPVSAAEMIAVPAGSPAQDLKGFIELAKSANGATFSSAGVGSGSHLATEYFFKQIEGAKILHVPFRGGALALQAAIGNQVDLVASTSGIPAQIKEGLLRGIAVANSERVASAPDVPTYAEQGYGDYEASSWVGFFVPSGTDPAIIEILNTEINAILADATQTKTMTDLGYLLSTRDSKQTRVFLDGEIKKWGDMVETVGVSLE